MGGHLLYDLTNYSFERDPLTSVWERRSQNKEVMLAFFHLMNDLIVYIPGANGRFCRDSQ